MIFAKATKRFFYGWHVTDIALCGRLCFFLRSAISDWLGYFLGVRGYLLKHLHVSISLAIRPHFSPLSVCTPFKLKHCDVFLHSENHGQLLTDLYFPQPSFRCELSAVTKCCAHRALLMRACVHAIGKTIDDFVIGNNSETGPSSLLNCLYMSWL